MIRNPIPLSIAMQTNVGSVFTAGSHPPGGIPIPNHQHAEPLLLNTNVAEQAARRDSRLYRAQSRPVLAGRAHAGRRPSNWNLERAKCGWG